MPLRSSDSVRLLQVSQSERSVAEKLSKQIINSKPRYETIFVLLEEVSRHTELLLGNCIAFATRDFVRLWIDAGCLVFSSVTLHVPIGV